ncbi:MAG: choice-of-anchor Q domain-containing protein, partial [bacterium]
GGISCTTHSSPRIVNCDISGNTAAYAGGGIHCEESSPAIVNCAITGNSSTSLGGGINCSFFSSPEISNCSITGNDGGIMGGGISCTSHSSPRIMNCDIRGNTVTNGGGGIRCKESSPVIINCAIIGNSSAAAWGFGGGMYCHVAASPVITNCTVSENWAGNLGGGIYCDDPDSTAVIGNCILWNDAPGEINGGGVFHVVYSDVQGGYGDMGTNHSIDADPLFVDPNAGDFHLQGGSPCINAGAGVWASAFDKEGIPRPVGAEYDMGAYEYAHAILPVPSGYATIQGAIDASVDWDVILVSPGVYTECIDPLGKAITITSTSPWDTNIVETTVIDANQQGSVVVFTGVEGEDTVLSGFTLQNGRAEYGGGITCNPGTSPTITRCIVTGNTATVWGGGIRIRSASPAIAYCTVQGNSAEYGAGIYYQESSSGQIAYCVISNNTAHINAGGIFCHTSSPAITNCTIRGNIAETGYGGGMRINSASPTLINCVIADNHAIGENGRAGGICLSSASPLITHCTIGMNSAAGGGGIYSSNEFSAPSITSSILWGDSAEELVLNGSIPTITYSDIGQSEYTDPESHTINQDPLFMNPTGGNFRLQEGSPCIDAGKPDSLITDDRDGAVRPRDGDGDGSAVSDMGAYEY